MNENVQLDSATNEMIAAKLAEVQALQASHSAVEVKAAKAEMAKEIASVLEAQHAQSIEIKSMAAQLASANEQLAKSRTAVSPAGAKDAFFESVDSTLRGLKMGTQAEIGRKSQSISDSNVGGAFANDPAASSLFVSYMADVSPMFREARVVTVANGSTGIKLPRKKLVEGASFKGEKQVGGRTLVTTDAVTVMLSRILSTAETTEELLQGQSIISEQSLTSDIFADIAYQIQDACLNGDGQSKPLGLLKEKFLIDTAHVSAGQTDLPSALTWQDLIAVKKQFSYDRYRENGKYYGSFDVLADLMLEVDGEGRPLWNYSTNTILGSQFVVMAGMPKGLAAGQIALLYGDLKQAYTIALGSNQTVRADYLTGAESDLVKITCGISAGGRVVDEQAIRAVIGATV
jgi:HK97 family phage major capsid protein